MSRLVSVANYANAAEAEYAASYLQSEGIQAAVDGATAGTALSHIGAGLGGIKVLVDETQAKRSENLLRELNETDRGEPWYCGKCGEAVDGTFAACWSCGGDRDQVAAEWPDAEEPGLAEPLHIQTSDNPYEPIVEGLSKAGQPETNEEAQDLLDRAWKAIILGTCFVPLVLQPYGLYLLYQSTRVTNEFSPEMTRQFRKVLIAGLLSFCFWGLLLLSFFG